MARDTEAKKIRKWADTGDRIDPDDSTLSPVLSRATGWPATFSADDGEVPRRQVINQLFRELTGLGDEINTIGIVEWDADLDYTQHAIINSSGRLKRATVATGPATSNATDPTASGQTIWEDVQGEVETPSTPDAPSGTASNGEVFWSWPCPQDNGQRSRATPCNGDRRADRGPHLSALRFPSID